LADQTKIARRDQENGYGNAAISSAGSVERV
jgi:hypothetical protein